MDSENRLPTELNDFQFECVNAFVHAAKMLSLPKSLGEIYGLLFSTEEPLPLDEIARRLAISKGSSSMGLRWLKDLRAVREATVAGDRREHFTAEIELRKLATGLLSDRIERRLEDGESRIRRIKQAAKAVGVNGNREFLAFRLKRIERWYLFARRVVPVLRRFAQAF